MGDKTPRPEIIARLHENGPKDVVNGAEEKQQGCGVVCALP